MSKITTLFSGNGLGGVKLDDGSIFHFVHELGDLVCDILHLNMLANGKKNEAWNSHSQEVYEKSIINVASEYHNDYAVIKLEEDKLLICYKNSSNRFDECINGDLSGLGPVFDFFENHNAYRIDGCTLLVEYNNCTQFLY